MSYRIEVNGEDHEVDADGDLPLLWVLRDVLGMRGNEVCLRHGAVRSDVPSFARSSIL